MSVDVYVSGIRDADGKLSDMLDLKSQCDKLHIAYPPELREYFRGSDALGMSDRADAARAAVEVDLSAYGPLPGVADGSVEEGDGIVIDLSKLPDDIKRLRIYIRKLIMADENDVDDTLRTAFELVLELAVQNMIDDNDDDLAGEALRQQDAIDKVGTLLDTMVIQRKRIAELEASVENWRGIAMNADGDGSLAHERALKAERERDELQALIDKQHERTASADAAWQAATGRHDTLPDLGALIEWLQDRAEQAEQKRDAALSLIRAAYERLGLHQIDHTTVHSLATDDLIRQLIAAGGAR